MTRKLLWITVLSLISGWLASQMPVGSWSDHLRYNTASAIAGNSLTIYASTGSSILAWNKEFNELRRLSPVNGLSETGISDISWSEEKSMLVIAYESTNIDLFTGNTVHNIPEIRNKFTPGTKRINRVRTLGKNAYLATGFGIVIIDLEKQEIHDTWKPGPGTENNEVYDIAFGNGSVYAATENGLWQADISNQGLAYYGNWDLLSIPEPGSFCNHLIFSGETLYCNVPQGSAGDRIYAINGEIKLFSFSPGIIINSFDPAPRGFTISSANFLKHYNSDGSLINLIDSYGWGPPDISQGIVIGSDLWIADKNHGIVMGKNMTEFAGLSLSGPSINEVANITSVNGKTILCAGGIDNSWNGLKRSFQVSIHENNLFTNIVHGISTDAMRSFIDPANSSRFFISSWGSGLYEYENNILVKHYDSSNSPLQNSGTTVPETKVCGLAMDKSKNLWITQPDGTENIKILKPDGSWILFPVTINAPLAGDIISTGNGQMWIILPGGHGLFIIDDNNTTDFFTDDRMRKLTVRDSDGKIINNVFSAAEDLDGNIWIGTDQGPVIYDNADLIFEDAIRGTRIKVARNDGSGLADFMLGTESITAISVDGANRKWFGTKSSGAYLLAADGTEVIKSYNTSNSPMFSDSIASIAIDNITGEVWFGTSEGVLSVRELATSGRQSYNDVYSFPNPVREGYLGNVTITGLMKETQIKITDISGNLVYETRSEGGQASWDLSTYDGRRVKTGVYIVFCASSDGTESCVTKILVAGK
jgi:hypothetical protein